MHTQPGNGKVLRCIHFQIPFQVPRWCHTRSTHENPGCDDSRRSTIQSRTCPQQLAGLCRSQGSSCLRPKPQKTVRIRHISLPGQEGKQGTKGIGWPSLLTQKSEIKTGTKQNMYQIHPSGDYAPSYTQNPYISMQYKSVI
jgi:hypothetical protein